MRIDINLLFPLGRRYGSPPTSKVTCLRCGFVPCECAAHADSRIMVKNGVAYFADGSGPIKEHIVR